VIGTLYARNLRHHRMLLLALCAGTFVLEVMIVRFGAQIESGLGMETLVRQFMPAELQQVFGSQLGLLSFAGLVGFGFQHPITLAAAVAFVLAVCTIPSAERESGLLDLILSRPLPRARYLAAILLLLLTGAVLLPLALLTGASVGLRITELPAQVSASRYLPAAAGLACLLLAVGGTTLLLAARARRRGKAAAQATGLFLALYWLELLAELWEPLRVLSRLSPFQYFRPMESVVTGVTPWREMAVLAAVFLVTAALALLRFRRQDL
jgi:ABC-2 type transport system permease protein